MAIGGRVGVKVAPRVAVRLWPFDYLRTSHLNYEQDNLRYSAGIVVKF